MNSGTLNFTRYMFRKMYDKQFVVGNHHIAICEALNRVLDGECKRLIINIAPRYGKTELAVKNFIAMGLAVNPRAKFVHLSYSSNLAQDNSVAIKDIVTSESYRELFPGTKIKFGSDTKSRWDTEAGGGVYATSTLGQITGFGAGLVEEDGKPYEFGGAIVIDDPIKPEDALSDILREKVNQRFETTIRNRVNSRNTPIIIIMQRLHENDLCGYLTKTEPGEWEVLALPVIADDEALWSFKHTMEELQALRRINPFVFDTQYMQNPKPMEGLMYDRPFKTYQEIPYTHRAIRKNYTDTADTGEDFLCSIDYIDTEVGNFILNVEYSKDSMEATEPRVAKMLTTDGVTIANIESNNGGRGFARNVERILRESGNAQTEVCWFHQSANKMERIFSKSNDVMNLTYFPEGWETMWPAFYSELSGLRKVGKNAHDDGADCLTGTVEFRGSVNFESYDGEVHGNVYVEVYPQMNGRFVLCRVVEQNGELFVTDGRIGETLSWGELKTLCDGEVHLELPHSMRYYANDFRANVAEAWARRERGNKGGYIESFREMARRCKVRRVQENEAFVRNLMDYDGQGVFEAMYALCSICDRIKRKSNS